MRGVAGGSPDLMEASERAMVEWAFTRLGLQTLHLSILSFNFMARSVHERLGFSTTQRIHLRREERSNCTALIPCPRKRRR